MRQWKKTGGTKDYILGTRKFNKEGLSVQQPKETDENYENSQKKNRNQKSLN